MRLRGIDKACACMCKNPRSRSFLKENRKRLHSESHLGKSSGVLNDNMMIAELSAVEALPAASSTAFASTFEDQFLKTLRAVVTANCSRIASQTPSVTRRTNYVVILQNSSF